MFTAIWTAIRRRAQPALCAVHRHLLAGTRPATGPRIGSIAGDLTRTRAARVAENAFLRQQLVVQSRQVERPVRTRADRLSLVLLARLVRGWRAALRIVQPETLLRWHRQGFRLVWRAKAAASKRPHVSAETVAAIQRLAAEHRRWGAERIRGELRKLGSRVGKRTVRRHMRAARPQRPPAGRPGPPSCATTPTRPGPAIASRSSTAGSGRASPSSSSNSGRAGWSTWASRATPRLPGWPSSRARPRRSTRGHATASATTTASTAPRSTASRRAAGSPSCARPSGHRRRTRPASASWAVCGARASITSSSWARGTCDASCGSTRRTATPRGHTKVSGRLSPAPRVRRRLPARLRPSCPSPCWADRTTTTAGRPDRSLPRLTARLTTRASTRSG